MYSRHEGRSASRVILMALASICLLSATICNAQAVSTRLVVRFQDETENAFGKWEAAPPDTSIYAGMNGLNTKYNLQSAKSLWRGNYAAVKNIWVLEFPTDFSSAKMDTVLAEYAALDRIDGVEFDQPLTLTSEAMTVTPNDFWYNNSYNYDISSHYDCFPDPTHQRQWHLTRMNYERAWPITRGDPNVVVVVIDTGLDYNHPDIESNVLWNLDELNGEEDSDDDQNGYWDDFCGWDFADTDNDVIHDPHDYHDYLGQWRHGTAMSGVIAALSNNQDQGEPAGVTGIAWEAKVLPLKIFSGYRAANLD